ncbi:VWA domain-containing protein [Thiomicrorhabdus sp. Milos-T2]|uniref:VWA domain-containing protein n=1 Tax=Thiomicrorhabdus sp. Milos-T2 TaxID=90814 RepID=UPI000493B5F7|nr:VWA domain-containing protein [Thiomicrorhabdus sp. Milos-T2]
MLDTWLNNELVWRAPIWLWALLLPVLVAVVQRFLKQRQKQNYADSHLWPWVAVDSPQTTRPGSSGFEFKQIMFWPINLLRGLFRPSRLLALAWLCFVIAIAEPRSLDTTYDMQTRQGVDVMVDLDVSRSMTAEDVQPNRFLYAKSIVESLVNQLETNDRVALSVFGGQPHSVLPLTYDKSVFSKSLNLIEPGMLPTQGSWLDLALIGALNTLSQTGRPAKVLLVFTDGAPPFWKPIELPSIVQQLKAAKSQKQSDTGVKVIYIGVGQTRSTTIPDPTHSSGNLHVNGLLVQSRLEENQLVKLADKTEGLYLRAQSGQDFMQKLMDEIAQTTSAYQESQPRKNWHSYSQPFMVIGIISLLLAFYGWQLILGLLNAIKTVWDSLLGGASTDNEKPHPQNDLGKSTNIHSLLLTGLLLPIVLLGLNSWSTPANAENNHSSKQTLQQAYQAFNSESYELAESLYDAVPNYKGWFGAGASAYKNGDLEAAVLYFRQAAWQAPTQHMRAQSLYNLGNSYYQANLLPQAIESFKQALLYQSPYEKAEHNLALAQERLNLEIQGKLKKSDKPGKEDSEGSRGSDSQGAFYGGQKPGDSNSKEPGFGSDGDASSGNRSGKKVNIPEIDALTNYRLNPSIVKLRLNSLQDDKSVNKVLIAQHKQQRAEKFEHQLQQLQDDQKALLQRLFEREEGFHAKQDEAHPIPGVQPW